MPKTFESKLFLAISTFLILAGVVYGIFADDDAGIVLLVAAGIFSGITSVFVGRHQMAKLFQDPHHGDANLQIHQIHKARDEQRNLHSRDHRARTPQTARVIFRTPLRNDTCRTPPPEPQIHSRFAETLRPSPSPAASRFRVLIPRSPWADKPCRK
jgi:hypothetical protein